MPELSAHRRPPAVPTPRRRRIPRWVTLLIIAAVTLTALNAFGTSYLQTYRLRREADRLRADVRLLHRENAQLREEIRRLHTPQYIERLAREELGLVRPGEVSIIIVRQSPKPRPTSSP